MSYNNMKHDSKEPMKTRILLIMSVVLIASVSGVNAQSWMTNGLVAYYPFNGNANDVTGNGNHGQIYGNVVAANDRFGNAASAYHFDGSLGNIWVTNTVLNIGQTSYTISGWFCSDDVTKIDQTVFNTVPHPGVALVLNSSYAPTYFDYSVGNATSWHVLNAHGPKHDYTNQVWYHVAFTKEGTNYCVFVNGKVDATPTVPQSAGYNYNAGCLFGACNDTGLGVFKGRLDDFRIYNRALSSNEVTQLYSAEAFTPPHAATATASLLGGSLSGITLTDRGYGYTNAPRVLIMGGGGSGASATAVVSNGVVIAINITSAGSGYTTPPQILIAAPPSAPSITISVSRFNVIQYMTPGWNYVLEQSSDLESWTSVGPQFTAESVSITNEFSVEGAERCYYRIRQVP